MWLHKDVEIARPESPLLPVAINSSSSSSSDIVTHPLRQVIVPESTDVEPELCCCVAFTPCTQVD